MGNYKNLKEDKEFFPYEYGSSRYENMQESVFSLLRRQELASNFDLILKHTYLRSNLNYENHLFY